MSLVSLRTSLHPAPPAWASESPAHTGHQRALTAFRLLVKLGQRETQEGGQRWEHMKTRIYSSRSSLGGLHVQLCLSEEERPHASGNLSTQLSALITFPSLASLVMVS